LYLIILRVFNYFKKFKELVEKKSDYSLKSLRIDRGEFYSNKFNEFSEDQRIKILVTMSKSPQQNGMVERKNRSILNIARSMLKIIKMP
jgi:IS30 family transposase